MKNKFSSIFKINKFTFNNISLKSFASPAKKTPAIALQDILDRPLHENHYVHKKSTDNKTEHKTYFSPTKYTKVLDQQQRIDTGQGVPFVDNAKELNPQTMKGWTCLQNFECPKPNQIYEVMVPHANELARLESNIIDETEIRARIYNLLRQFDYMDLKDFDFKADYEKDLGLDSLDWTAILTSIEYEFNTVFNDSFYEHWRNLDDVVNHLRGDELIF